MTTIPCPHCGEPIQPAQLLGTLSKGKPKRLSQEERAAKAARLAKVRYLRHTELAHALVYEANQNRTVSSLPA